MLFPNSMAGLEKESKMRSIYKDFYVRPKTFLTLPELKYLQEKRVKYSGWDCPVFLCEECSHNLVRKISFEFWNRPCDNCEKPIRGNGWNQTYGERQGFDVRFEEQSANREHS
jgi:hypothetical protein